MQETVYLSVCPIIKKIYKIKDVNARISIQKSDCCLITEGGGTHRRNDVYI